jgi:eukaryotic-like serine/threonine-protein kinase
MVRRSEPEREREGEPVDRDERLGEAIESFLALLEVGAPADPEEFATRYPGLEDDLLAALEGLAMVQGLVGAPGREPGGTKLETGRRVAGYRIVRELGRGGMGVVYEAVHVGLDRPVALKVLGAGAAPDSNGRRRFLNEARTAAGLHHTHIVPVFDVGQVGGLCYYAMQRIEGSGLDRVVRHLRHDRSNAAGSGSITRTAASSFSFLGRFGSRLSPGRRSAAFGGSATGPWPPRGVNGNGNGSGVDLGLSATESLTGGGVSRREHDDGPPPFEPPRGGSYYRWVAEVGRQAAEALGYAHRRGVIHRDVKPSNLLVDGRGLIWVADFGLARRLADPGLTQHDSLLGTPRYMSPEQARTGPIDGRADLFSLGATLYELLTLRPPFEGRSAAELIDQIARVEPASPRATDPRIPLDLETIVLKLLAKRPDDRYPDAAELADDLGRFLNHEPVRARRISPLGRLWRVARRHPGISLVSTAAVTTVLAVTTFAYIQIRQDRDAAVHARDDEREARRELLWQSATNLRTSTDPDRKDKALGLIRQAATLKPEPSLKARLRDEAAEFLVLRDAQSLPAIAIATGRTLGLAFGPDGAHLVALTVADGARSLSVWDPATQTRLTADRPLRAADPAPSLNEGDRDRRRGGGNRDRGGPDREATTLSIAGPCVAAADTRGIVLFDAATGARVRHLALGGRRVSALYSSLDGRRLVVIDSPDSPRERGPVPPTPSDRRGLEVTLWDIDKPDTPLATLARFEVSPQAGPQSRPLVAISPDGATVAVATFHETAVSLFAGKTGAALASIETQTELTALALGADHQLATAGGGEVRLWDVDSRTALPSLLPNQSFIRRLRFSPRGALLAILGPGGREVELWDTAAHAPVAVLPTPDTVDDVAFSPDGTTIAATTQGTTTPLWHLVESDVRQRLGGFDTTTRSLSFRHDGLLALGSWKGTVRFWDAGRCVHPAAAATKAEPDVSEESDEPPTPEGPASLAFDDLGRLVTLDPDTLRVWANPPHCSEGATRVALPDAPGPGKMVRLSLSPSRDGKVMAIVRDGQLFLWRSNAPAALTPILTPGGLSGGPGPGSGPGPGPNRGPGPGGPGRGRPMSWQAVAVTPTGDRVFLADVTGRFYVWSLANGGDPIRPRPLYWTGMPPDATNMATSVALSPDGVTLAIGTRVGVVALFNAETGAPLSRLGPPSGETKSGVSSLAFAPDSLGLAVGTQQGRVLLWSLATPDAVPLRLPGHRGGVTALSYAPDGRRLAAAGNDKTVDVWNLDRLRDDFARLGLSQ